VIDLGSFSLSVRATSLSAMKAKVRRDRRRATGDCINSDFHGKATHGVLCEKCRETHRKFR
jgi:hypothetical protein